MSYRTPARWLAPLALAAAALALLVVVASGGSGDDGGPAVSSPRTATGTTTAARTTATTTATTTVATKRTYTVQPGDVLSGIAQKTGVALERIESLNPSVDAQTLHAGQQIKLAP